MKIGRLFVSFIVGAITGFGMIAYFGLVDFGEPAAEFTTQSIGENGTDCGLPDYFSCENPKG